MSVTTSGKARYITHRSRHGSRKVFTHINDRQAALRIGITRPQHIRHWENSVSQAHHRAASKADGQPPSPTSQRQWTELSTYVLRIQPTVRCDLTTVGPKGLHRAISSFSTNTALLRHQILRVSSCRTPSCSLRVTQFRRPAFET